MPDFAAVESTVELRNDGSILFHSGREAAGQDTTLPARILHWKTYAPERIALRERAGNTWRTITYLAAWEWSGRVATALHAGGCSPELPLLILAGNGIDHAVVALAGMRIGVPVAPVSVAYASFGSYDRLRQLIDVSGAKTAFVGPEIGDSARAALASWGVRIMTMEELSYGAPDASLLEALGDTVRADSVAKLMFTSGSTGTPKAVMNTHRMMATNQSQLATVFPAGERPPVLFDWLPWSHTFGGNFVANMAFWNGGTLTIDDGRPTPALIGRTLAGMAEIGPTRYFSVPAGFEALIPAIEASPQIAAQAFRNLEFAFCAGAALSGQAHARMSALLHKIAGREIPLIGGWGSTETAPCATVVHFPNAHWSNIGVPLPGVTIKMVPEHRKYELRVKGPNVMPGYWRAPEATAAAFDEEGYYRIGDSGKFVDPANPQLGLAFDGRLAENFKLSSGTWINVGPLRLAVTDAARPFVRDAVIAGHDRDEIGVLLFLNEAACREHLSISPHQPLAENVALKDKLRAALAIYNASAGGSSMRIARFRVEDTPPSSAIGEITDKGYINQRAVLHARAGSVETMYADNDCKV